MGNFKEADHLHKSIDKLESTLEEERAKMPTNLETKSSESALPQFTNERGHRVTFESRYELQEEIIRFKTLVENAAKNCKFKEASQNQQCLDQLEDLKSLLPTAEELNTELTRKKAEMESAIQNKDFGSAELLHGAVEELEKKFE